MWNNIIQISKVTSSNCGGVGAWIDNPLSSPNPSGSLWRGFQLGGGGGRRTRGNTRNKNKPHKKPHMKAHKKASKTKKRRQIKRRRNW